MKNVRKIFLKKYGNMFLLMVIYFYMLYCNMMTPLLLDDYAYSFIWNNDVGGNLSIVYSDFVDFSRISSFYDILISQYNHYFSWGGRSIAHSLLQFFLWQGKSMFNYLNSLAFVLLIVSICRIAIGKNWYKSKTSYFAWCFFFLWICTVSFGEVNLWVTGSCNYLWMSLLQVNFVYYCSLGYFSQLQHMRLEKNSFTKNMKWLFLGIITGWTNENMGLMVIFITMFFLYNLYRKRIKAVWMFYGLIGLLIGYVLMIAAPGNVARGIMTLDIIGYNEVEGFTEHVSKCIMILGLQTVMWLWIVPFFSKKMDSDIVEKYRERISFIMFLFFLGIFNTFIMIFSPTFPARSSYGSTVLFCIAVLSIMRLYEITGEKQENKIHIAVKYIGGVFMMLSLLATSFDELDIQTQWQADKEVLFQASGKGIVIELMGYREKNPLLDKLVFYHTAVANITNDVNAGSNQTMARYYGVQGVYMQGVRRPYLDTELEEMNIPGSRTPPVR